MNGRPHRAETAGPRLRGALRHVGLLVCFALVTTPPLLWEVAGWWAGHSSAADMLRGVARCAVIELPGVIALWLCVMAGARRHLAIPAALRWGVTVVFSALIAAGSCALLYAAIVLPGDDPMTPGLLFAMRLPWYLVLASLLLAAQEFARRSAELDAAAHADALAQVERQRRLDEARSQLLQAQIEPHFIFNALANVRRLLHTDPTAGGELLDDLLRYLEEALPRLREDQATLGREVELVRAYLAVHRVRMGDRLRAEIDVPASLAAQPLPPMLLLTLVENAIKHGLQPMVEGGTVRVTARENNGQVTLSVEDDGRGLSPGLGSGTGLANIRARLRALYGSAADLALAVNAPRGVRATIRLPAASA